VKPILLVEDDEFDASQVKRIFLELGVPNPVVHVWDGEAALEYLRQNASESPCVILLDLNLPGLGGFDVLRLLKDDAAMRDIPVVILTTSCADDDRVRSRELGAAEYVVKCLRHAEFVEALKRIDCYWLTTETPADRVADAP
jgi:CheY-like chemotaxis protein